MSIITGLFIRSLFFFSLPLSGLSLHWSKKGQLNEPGTDIFWWSYTTQVESIQEPYEKKKKRNSDRGVSQTVSPPWQQIHNIKKKKWWRTGKSRELREPWQSVKQDSSEWILSQSTYLSAVHNVISYQLLPPLSRWQACVPPAAPRKHPVIPKWRIGREALQWFVTK